MRNRELSIFKRIWLPLVLLVFVQSLFYMIFTFASGAISKMDTNAVNILNQTAENRKIILENNMIQHWSNVGEDVNQVNQNLKALLERENLTVNDFLKDVKLQQEFLNESTDSASFTIRKNSVNGFFIVFANQEFLNRGYGKLKGLYFRDLDSRSNPSDNSDILLERGDAYLCTKFGIPFDTLWTSDFTVYSKGGVEGCDFFIKPFFTALEHPELEYQHMGYWSHPFYLNPNDTGDSYEMITYSVPLICDGQVYGVLGVDICAQAITDAMPSRELGRDRGQSGYMLVRRDSESEEMGPFSTLLSAGTASSMISDVKKSILLKETKYDGIYDIEDTKIYNSQACGTLHSLNLYDTNTPFSKDAWYLMAVSSHDEMFSLSRRLLLQMGLGAVLSVLAGVFFVYLIASLVTKPIRSLSNCIEGSRENELQKFERCHIREIDGLYDVLCDLTARQRETEDALMEEKGRYQAALESSTSTLFEYDAADNSVCLYNMAEGDGQRIQPMQVIENCREKLCEDGYIHPDDREIVRDFFEQVSDQKNCTLRCRMPSDASRYSWVELKGKTIYSASHQVVKIIGSLRDIQQEKMMELEAEEQKKRDSLTGLYNRQEGKRIVDAALREGREGCLMLLDIDRFWDINDQLGIVVGDIILEEVGCTLAENVFGKDMAFRYGGDEFAVWFPGRTREDVEKVYETISSTLEGRYQEAELPLILHGGCTVLSAFSGRGTVDELMSQAVAALVHARKSQEKNIVFYEDMAEEERHAGEEAQTSINEIVGLNYNAGVSITTLTFNMFDKSDDLKKVIPILFQKIGRYFRLDHIVMTQADADFGSSYVAVQWHRGGSRIPEGVKRFETKVYRECVNAIREDFLKFSDSLADLEPNQRHFFSIQARVSGMCFPITINDVYVGSIAFLDEDTGRDWEEKDRNSLNEIVKIITTNLGKARSDLASQAKSDFLSRMSHEIRTPMNAIIGMTAIAMQNKGLTPELAGCLEKIDTSSHYLLSIINDILDMSRIERGKMQLSIDTFDLRKLIGDVDTLIRPQTEERKQNFTVCVEELLHPLVFGDAMRLNQILINLLGNALKFTPREGDITLTVRQRIVGQEQSELFISVRDTGIGISPENQERIFRAFEQEEVSTVIQYGGTGLGLAISSNLVIMMGGKLELRSEQGKGSEFYFTIPAKLSDKEPSKRENVDAAGYDFTGKIILLVEDNDLNLEIAQTILEADGFRVETARDGKEAVERFDNSPEHYYDLILMDIRMPVMDGLEATRTIRRQDRSDAHTVPIIAMTANAFDEDMKKSIECGMNGHLAKPIDLKMMHEMLVSLLSQE